jgi:hypothetical protein
MVVESGIELPGIHFQDQNTEQKLNNKHIIIKTMIEQYS